MGSHRRERDDQRRAEDIEVGSDGAHDKDNREHNRRAGRRHSDWTDGSYYDEQFAENDGHDEGVYKWGDDCEFRDQWEDDRMHEPNKFTRTDGRKHQGQYNDDGFERQHVGSSGEAWRENHHVSAGTQGGEVPDEDAKPICGTTTKHYGRLRRQ